MSIKYVSIVNNRPTTTSRLIAHKFGKRHDNVLRDIQNLECSDKFRALNFEVSSYSTKQNKAMPEYQITYDGFTMLVMGFTGKKAMQFKEEYILEFNAMRDSLNKHSLILAKILLDAPAEWRKTFPDGFFLGVHKIYGHQFDRKKGTYSFVGKFINKYIYNHLLIGLSIELKTKRELQKLSGIKLHQFLEENAKDILKVHVSQIEALLRVSYSSDHFESLFRNFTQPNQMKLAV